MKKFFNLTVLSMTVLAIAAPADARFLENLARPADGRIVTVTDDKESPGPGYQLLGCGTLPNTNTPACSWLPPQQAVAVQAPQQTTTSSGVMTLEQFNASQPAVSTASYNAPTTQVQQASTNVANQPNPMINGAKPDEQVACQTGDGSFRCARINAKPSFIQTVLGLAVGAALVTEAFRGNSYYGGVVNGPFIPGGSNGGRARRY